MIDRIEELLSGMAAEEKDDEEQEGVPALTRTADVPSLREDGGEAGGTGPAGEPAPVEMRDGRSGGRTAGEIAAERPVVTAGKAADGATEDTLWKKGPVWTVRSAAPEIDAVRRQAMADRTGEAAEVLGAAKAGGTEPAGAEQMAAGARAEWAAGIRAAEASAGLEGLYRQAVRGVRPAAPALPPERAGRTARVQEPGSAASLAVDELDRAVRRDSRRYDGGMSIF